MIAFDFSDIFLHAALVVGSLGVFLSALYLIFILGWVVVGRAAPPGWVSSISVTIVLNSIQLFFVGILGGLRRADLPRSQTAADLHSESRPSRAAPGRNR